MPRAARSGAVVAALTRAIAAPHPGDGAAQPDVPDDCAC
jgi:hypothetical protein